MFSLGRAAFCSFLTSLYSAECLDYVLTFCSTAVTFAVAIQSPNSAPVQLMCLLRACTCFLIQNDLLPYFYHHLLSFQPYEALYYGCLGFPLLLNFPAVLTGRNMPVAAREWPSFHKSCAGPCGCETHPGPPPPALAPCKIPFGNYTAQFSTRCLNPAGGQEKFQLMLGSFSFMNQVTSRCYCKSRATYSHLGFAVHDPSTWLWRPRLSEDH